MHASNLHHTWEAEPGRQRFLGIGRLPIRESRLGMVSVEAFGWIGVGVAISIPGGDCDISAPRLSAEDGGVIYACRISRAARIPSDADSR